MLLHECYMDTHRVGLAAGEVCSPHYRLLSKQSRCTVCQVLIHQMKPWCQCHPPYVPSWCYSHR